MIVQLDTENADLDLTAQVTVLTDTPDVTNPTQCQGLIFLGDGVNNLDGTGGNFELTITIGSQTMEADPTIVVVSAGQTRAALQTLPFLAPANVAVVLKVKSPNVADTVVDVTAYLYDVAPVTLGTDQKALISTDAQDLSATLDVNTKLIAAGAVDSIIDEIVEGTYSVREALRIILAFAAGKASGGGTTTVTIRDTGDLKNRIIATVDANGNRTAVTLDET